MPDHMFSHVSAGYGGQGTLCGALGVASQYFRMVAFDEMKTHVKMIDELYEHKGLDSEGIAKPEVLKSLDLAKEPSHLL